MNDRQTELNQDHLARELDSGPLGLVRSLMKVNKLLEQELINLCRKYDLNLGEFEVLILLYRSPKLHQLTPGELCQILMVSSGCITHRVDLLEKKKLIVRSHSIDDRRSVRVQLSDLGYETTSELFDEYVETQKRLVSNLDVYERDIMFKYLSKWLISLEKRLGEIA